MKNLVMIALCAATLLSCNNKKEPGKFTVNGQIANAPDQKIYLEELFFSEKNPEVLDTGEIKNGHFTVSALAVEEGLYRIRLEKDSAFFVLINDKDEIGFTADYNKLATEAGTFASPANGSLKKFLEGIRTQRIALENKSAELRQMAGSAQSDSLLAVNKNELAEKEVVYNHFISQYVDTTTDPVIGMFALGYSQTIEPDKLEKPVASLAARFPKHMALNSMVAQYNQLIAQFKAKPHEGGMAPEINLPDTTGKPFALSMLKGKYVLVDFWASWCAPCRAENPNVVKAYNNFKDKNFTVLGVSLDQDKAQWEKAIKSDSLNWYHISDLKYWSSAAVTLYGFDGIPYNVLVDPTGKIIAMNLRGDALESKLQGILK
ncbi:TlpA disulfide reductase family protein [soil metagenome]